MEKVPIQVIYDGGVYLPEVNLWLDPNRRKERAFVSHAHADHVAPHAESICSATTKTIVKTRFGGRGEVVGYEFGEEFEIAGFRCVLLPAGHILGSAQIWMERKTDGASLLYTGDFKTRPGAACENIEWRKADTLIMETTFGIPKYRLPPSDEVIAEVTGFVRQALDEGEVPMLAAYSLGKAQELIVAIHREAPGLNFLLHSSVANMTEIYHEYNYPLPGWRTFETKQETDFSGCLVIAPPNVLRSAQLSGVKKRRTAMISGWGIDPRAKYRYGVDHVFPLSDHADYDDLLDYVEQVDPELVLTLHGYASEFARDVRETGREAWSLVSSNQLELWVDSK